MQPQLKSKVRCTDREIGEVTKVIVDPLSHQISHIVVSMNGSGERQVAMALVQTVTDSTVQLRNTSSEIVALPPFNRGRICHHARSRNRPFGRQAARDAGRSPGALP